MLRQPSAPEADAATLNAVVADAAAALKLDGMGSAGVNAFDADEQGRLLLFCKRC
jgi:hypothetical protein